MKTLASFFANCIFFSLIVLNVVGCKTTPETANDSNPNSVTSTGFAYDRIQANVVDARGTAIADVSVSIWSSRWNLELIGHDPLLMIPTPGRGWIWKTGEGKKLGATDLAGVMVAENIKLKARGNIPGQSPAGVELYVDNDLYLFCPNGTVAGTVRLDLKTESSIPQTTNPKVGKDRENTVTSGCSLRIGANEDTYKVMKLECKSTRLVSDIESDKAKARQSCVR